MAQTVGTKDNPLIIPTKKIFGKPHVQFNRNNYNRVDWEETRVWQTNEYSSQTISLEFYKIIDNNGEIDIEFNGDDPSVNNPKYEVHRTAIYPPYDAISYSSNINFDKLVDPDSIRLEIIQNWSRYIPSQKAINISWQKKYIITPSAEKDQKHIKWVGNPMSRFKNPSLDDVLLNETIKILGNFYNFETVNRSLTAPGTNGSNPYKMRTNKMFTTDLQPSGKTLGEMHAQSILDHYKNGKQTINDLEVAITDDGFYYAQDFANKNYFKGENANRVCHGYHGEEIISNKFIEVGDVVCPMRLLRKEYTPIRKKNYFGFPLEIARWTNHEEPLSKYGDGSARVFEVTSSEYRYQYGVRRYRLKMREVT